MASDNESAGGPPEDSLKFKTGSYLMESVLRNRGESKAWRVLVVDYHSTRVLSSACSMYDILNEGFCLVDSLESDSREHLPQLSALYLYDLTPCEESISTLIQDFASKPPRYGNCAVYFTSALTRELFDMFTHSAVVPYMRMLKEVNVDYLSYESHVFSFDTHEGFALHFDEALAELRDPYQKELSEKLASLLCVAIGAKPGHIRYATPAAQLATYTRRALNALPLDTDPACQLLIVDRSVDMISPLLHEFTYLAMLEDVLDKAVHDDEWMQTHTTAEGVTKERTVILDERDPVLYQIRHTHIEESIAWLVSNINTFTKVNEIHKNAAVASSASSASSSSNADDRSSATKVVDLDGIQTFMHHLPKCQALGAKYSIHLDLTQLMLNEFKRRKLARIASVQQDVANGIDNTGKAFNPAKAFEEVKAMIMDSSMCKEDLFRTILILATSRAFKASQLDALLALGAFGEEEAKAVANMRRIVFASEDESKEAHRGFFSGLSKRHKKRQQQQSSSSSSTSVEFELSRWTPRLKSVIEALSTNTLDESEYPSMTLSPEKEGEEGGGVVISSGSGTAKRNYHRQANVLKSLSTMAPRTASQRIVVLVIGGITYSEIRAIHEIMAVDRRTEVLLGATHIIKPNEFAVDMAF